MGLSELRAPAADAAALAAVLSDPEIGGFKVRTLMNEPAHVVKEAVEDFLSDRSPDDLLLLHFFCHGITPPWATEPYHRPALVLARVG